MNDWEVVYLGIEYNNKRGRYRYQNTKKWISTDVPVKSLSLYTLALCEQEVRIYNIDRPLTPMAQSERFRKCAEFLEHRIALLKTLALISKH